MGFYICMCIYIYIKGAGIAQSVEQRATGWTIGGSNAGGGRDRLRGKLRILHKGYLILREGKVAGAWC